MLIDVNPDETLYYLLIVSLERLDENFNSVPNKRKDLFLKLFNMIKWVNDSKTLIKVISYECSCKLNNRKCNSSQKRNKDLYRFECESPIKNCACKKIFYWNSRICVYVCNKDCNIGEYFNIWTCK